LLCPSQCDTEARSSSKPARTCRRQAPRGVAVSQPMKGPVPIGRDDGGSGELAGLLGPKTSSSGAWGRASRDLRLRGLPHRRRGSQPRPGSRSTPPRFESCRPWASLLLATRGSGPAGRSQPPPLSPGRSSPSATRAARRCADRSRTPAARVGIRTRGTRPRRRLRNCITSATVGQTSKVMTRATSAFVCGCADPGLLGDLGALR